jgi:hypothetical protein
MKVKNKRKTRSKKKRTTHTIWLKNNIKTCYFLI